jgi:hypothetical protein
MSTETTTAGMIKGRYGKIRDCDIAQIENIPEARIENKKETG